MDSCFNSKIPLNTEETFVYSPNSKTWINGLANNYKYVHYSELDKYLGSETIKRMIERINDDLYTYWPCPTCFAIGYCFSLCTLGLSFLCPYTCIRDARNKLNRNIVFYNETLNKVGLELSLKEIYCSSYLEIKIIRPIENEEVKENTGLNKNTNNGNTHTVSKNQI